MKKVFLLIATLLTMSTLSMAVTWGPGCFARQENGTNKSAVCVGYFQSTTQMNTVNYFDANGKWTVQDGDYPTVTWPCMLATQGPLGGCPTNNNFGPLFAVGGSIYVQHDANTGFDVLMFNLGDYPTSGIYEGRLSGTTMTLLYIGLGQ